MSPALEKLSSCLQDVLGDKVVSLTEYVHELTLVVNAADLTEVALVLRDHPELRFEQLTDLCGMDYQTYRDGNRQGPRFAVVTHLLSVKINRRLRVRVFAEDDDLPMVSTVSQVWPAASWYEREAFDLYGIVFENHPDLRRLLTDYGFIGHPFRKDFPLSGNVEMRYDPDQQRVVYQPVSIDPREVTPRIVREEHYGG